MKIRYGNKPLKKVQDPKIVLPSLLIGQGIAILLLIWLIYRG